MLPFTGYPNKYRDHLNENAKEVGIVLERLAKLCPFEIKSATIVAKDKVKCYLEFTNLEINQKDPKLKKFKTHFDNLGNLLINTPPDPVTTFQRKIEILVQPPLKLLPIYNKFNNDFKKILHHRLALILFQALQEYISSLLPGVQKSTQKMQNNKDIENRVNNLIVALIILQHETDWDIQTLKLKYCTVVFTNKKISSCNDDKVTKIDDAELSKANTMVCAINKSYLEIQNIIPQINAEYNNFLGKFDQTNYSFRKSVQNCIAYYETGTLFSTSNIDKYSLVYLEENDGAWDINTSNYSSSREKDQHNTTTNANIMHIDELLTTTFFMLSLLHPLIESKEKNIFLEIVKNPNKYFTFNKEPRSVNPIINDVVYPYDKLYTREIIINTSKAGKYLECYNTWLANKNNIKPVKKYGLPSLVPQPDPNIFYIQTKT